MHLSVILSSFLALLLLIPDSSHGSYISRVERTLQEYLGEGVNFDAFVRYDKLKQENGYKVILAQMINATNETYPEPEEGAVEVTVDGLEASAVSHTSSRSREVGRRTRRRLQPTTAGKKGSMMGDMGKKGSGKKGSGPGKGLKGCNICPEWSPAVQMERAKKAKKESEMAGKKGSGSASPGGSSQKKRRLNNDKDENDCCCDKDGGGKKKTGKDAAPPELKVELNLTTIF
eukprot:9289408-Ditylum_brightwellii.AAC.1